MNKQRGFTAAELLILLIYAAGTIGWVWNIVKIAQSSSEAVTGLFVVRCIGILVAPLGAVLGFF